MDQLHVNDVVLGVAIVIGLMILGRLFEGLGRVLRPSKRRKPRRKRRPNRQGQTDAPVPANAILVDGSNVMHWGGDPSQMVLQRVIAALKTKGFAPVVVFDASVGYRLFDRYTHGPDMADAIGLPRAHVYVVKRGVSADEVILDLAQIHGLRVVSNDQFRAWRVQFPAIEKKGAIVRGTWQEGSVIWRNPQLLG